MPLSLGFASIAAAYHLVLFFGRTWVDRDALQLMLPSREYLVDALRSGRLPEWYEGVAFGAPFAANPVHEVFAPFGWLLAFLGGPYGFDLYELLHLVILAGGLYCAARRLGAGPAGAGLGGTVLALCGYTTSMLPNALVPEMAWTPWVVWAALGLGSEGVDGSPRRRAQNWAAFIGVLAFQLLALEPATAMTAVLLALVVRMIVAPAGSAFRSLLPIAPCVVAAALLAAVVLVPALFLFTGSARSAGFDSGGLSWSFSPARSLELIWPWAFGRPLGDSWIAGVIFRGDNSDPFWAYSHFLGLPTLLMLAAARDRIQGRLLLGAAPFVLLALGPATPIYTAIPFLQRLVNFPEKFLFGALLLVSLGIARGADDVLANAPRFRSLRRVSVAGGVAMLGALALLMTSSSSWEHRLEARANEVGLLVDVPGALDSALWGGLIALLGVALFALGSFTKRRGLSALFVALSVVGPLVVVAGHTTNLASRKQLAPVPEVASTMLEAGDDDVPRYLRLSAFSPQGPLRTPDEIARLYLDSLRTNLGMRYGLASVRGFEPAVSSGTFRLLTEYFDRMNPSAFLALLSIDFVLVDRPQQVTLPTTRRSRSSGSEWTVLHNQVQRPRVFHTRRWTSARSVEESLRELVEPNRLDGLDRVSVVGLETDSVGGISPTCVEERVTPESIEIECDRAEEGVVVLLDEWAPGWRAEVEGSPREVLRVDGVFRGVKVEDGEKSILLTYRTPGLRLGASISLAALAAMLAWLVAVWRAAPRLADRPPDAGSASAPG